MAEGIFRRDALAAGVEVEIDSAGTGSWHEGELADRRARAVGLSRGCEMTMRARQVRASDFEEFDLIVAMDRQNERDLLKWEGSDPAKIRLACSYAPETGASEVPDPYYGGVDGFEGVADLLEAVSKGLLQEIGKRDS